MEDNVAEPRPDDMFVPIEVEPALDTRPLAVSEVLAPGETPPKKATSKAASAPTGTNKPKEG